MFRIREILILIVALLFLAPTVAAQRSKAPARDYFPLRVGNEWKYRHSEGGEFTFKILSEEKQADESMLYLLQKSASVTVHVWYTNANGWVLMHKEAYPEHEGLQKKYEPPRQFLRNPLTKGAAWTWRGQSVSQTEISESSKVIGPERVVVPAGKFLAMKVFSVIADGESIKKVTNWYVDGVGLVKSSTESGNISYGWELVDYNFKKTSPKQTRK